LAGLWPASQSLEDGRNLLFLTFSCLQIISLGVIQITVRVNIKTDRVIIYPVGFLNPQVNMNFSDGYTFSLPVFFQTVKEIYLTLTVFSITVKKNQHCQGISGF
jgi:hypothetical protein